MLFTFHLVAEIDYDTDNRNDNQYSVEHNLFLLVRFIIYLPILYDIG